MTFTKKIISAAVLMAFSSVSFAATTADSNIDINVTKDEYINITGTYASDNLTATTTAVTITDDSLVNGVDYPLGDLGINSNAPGDCTIDINSQHGFTLRLGDLIGGTPLHGANPYSVTWNGGTGTTFTAATTPVTVTGCDQLSETLTMNNPLIFSDEPGTYSDTLTIVVVSP